MRMILAYENSLSRDFAASHLAGSDPLLDIHPAASLAQSITLANRLDRLDVVALDLGLHDLDGLTGLRRFKRDCRHDVPVVLTGGSRDRSAHMCWFPPVAPDFFPTI